MDVPNYLILFTDDTVDVPNCLILFTDDTVDVPNCLILFTDDTVDVPSSDEERRDIVNIETWINKSDVKHAYDCQQVKDNGYMCPRYVNEKIVCDY